MSDFETANEIAVLLGGRVAKWTEQAGFGPPLQDSAGAAILGALKTMVLVDLRDEPARRSAWVTIDTLDLTATYNITLDGNLAAYDANAGGATNLQDVLEGIRDEINNTPAVAAIGTASVIDADDDGNDDTVLIRGVGAAHYTVVESATGTAVMAVRADPDAADLTLYMAAGGQASTAPAGWRFVNGGAFPGITFKGFSERFDTASFARLAVEVDSMSGSGDGVTITYQPGRVVIGPSLEVTP